MTTETENTNSEPQQPAPKLPALNAGGTVRPIVAQSLEDAWRIATAVCRAGMAPRGLETPDKAVIAILSGAEVGLPPMQALQSIAVIGGRPSLYGDGALAVVRSSGRLESISERYDPATETASCTVKRRGEKSLTRTFSRADAETAGLWGKKTSRGEPTPWITYPRRMLQMRARAWAMRDAFADALRGLGIAEEQGDIIEGTLAAPAYAGPPGLDGGPSRPASTEPGQDHQAEALAEQENEAAEARG